MVLRDGVWSDPVSVAISCCLDVNNLYLWKPPSTPRIAAVQRSLMTLETVPRSHGDSRHGGDTFPGGGNNYHQHTPQWASTSSVIAEPNNTENRDRSEVSNFFTPPEAVLCSYGLGNSRPVLPHRAATTAIGMMRKRPGASP